MKQQKYKKPLLLALKSAPANQHSVTSFVYIHVSSNKCLCCTILKNMEIQKVHTQMLHPCSGKKFHVLCALWENTCFSHMCLLMDNSLWYHPISQWLFCWADIPAVAVQLQTGPLQGILAYVPLKTKKHATFIKHTGLWACWSPIASRNKSAGQKYNYLYFTAKWI